MEGKFSHHIIKGMRRDLSRSKFTPDFSYENKNIRIVSRGDGSLFSVVNERGQKRILLQAKVPDVEYIKIYGNISESGTINPEYKNIRIFGNIIEDINDGSGPGETPVDIRVFGNITEDNGSVDPSQFYIYPDRLDFAYLGGTNIINVYCPDNTWTVSESLPSGWSTNRTINTVEVLASSNTQPIEQTGSISIVWNGIVKTCNLTQESTTNPSSFSISPTSHNFNQDGGAVFITVLCPDNTWEAHLGAGSPTMANLTVEKPYSRATLTIGYRDPSVHPYPYKNAEVSFYWNDQVRYFKYSQD